MIEMSCSCGRRCLFCLQESRILEIDFSYQQMGSLSQTKVYLYRWVGSVYSHAQVGSSLSYCKYLTGSIYMLIRTRTDRMVGDCEGRRCLAMPYANDQLHSSGTCAFHTRYYECLYGIGAAFNQEQLICTAVAEGVCCLSCFALCPSRWANGFGPSGNPSQFVCCRQNLFLWLVLSIHKLEQVDHKIRLDQIMSG